MGFPALSIDTARGLVDKRAKNEDWYDPRHATVVESAFAFDERSPGSLVRELERIKARYGDGPLPKTKGKRFEAEACEAVHRTLRLGPDCASSAEFWAWLTMIAERGAFADLVDWRFGAYETIKPRNYGIARPSEVFEGLFARLWFRGEMGYEADSDDPYSLARRGDIDIWRSHLFRQEFGRCHPVQRALLRFQYPDAHPNRKTLSNTGLRTLVKRLRIENATLSYELIDVEAVTEVIKAIAKEIQA